MNSFRWLIDAAIFLLDREPNIYTMKAKRREEIRLEVGCSIPTMNRAIHAIKVRDILIHSEISMIDLDKRLTQKNYILQLTIERVKGHMKYLYKMIEDIIKTGEIPDFKGNMRIKEIDKIAGAEMKS